MERESTIARGKLTLVSELVQNAGSTADFRPGSREEAPEEDRPVRRARRLDSVFALLRRPDKHWYVSAVSPTSIWG